jgi:serine/threonine protein kinase
MGCGASTAAPSATKPDNYSPAPEGERAPAAASAKDSATVSSPAPAAADPEPLSSLPAPAEPLPSAPAPAEPLPAAPAPAESIAIAPAPAAPLPTTSEGAEPPTEEATDGGVRYTQTFLEDYEVAEKLGEGMFGEVHIGTRRVPDPKGRIPARVAVKTMDKSKLEDLADITREIEILSAISHAHIVCLYEVFDQPGSIRLVMDHMGGGDLFERIITKDHFTEKDAADVTGQLCGALAHLHERHICHRDIKADNILLAGTDASDGVPMRIKLADFGVARRWADGERMFTACGTPIFAAPEIVAGDGYSTGASDCWSAGVVLYMMLCGFPPFMEEDMALLFALIMTGTYAFSSPSWDAISQPAKDTVSGLLTVDPSKRLSASQAVALPWVAGAATDAPLHVTDELKKTHKLMEAGANVMILQRALGKWRKAAAPAPESA